MRANHCSILQPPAHHILQLSILHTLALLLLSEYRQYNQLAGVCFACIFRVSTAGSVFDWQLTCGHGCMLTALS